jgi:hypothetical protein
MNFDEIFWHDSEIQGITIDRTNPGYNDVIEFIIIDPDDTRLKITFEKVYHAEFNMNFHIIASESILSASVSTVDSFPIKLKELLKFEGPLDDLKYFEIEANSTASTMKICALHCRIEVLSTKSTTN